MPQVPLPGIRYELVQARALSFPPQIAGRATNVAQQDGRVAGAPRPEPHRDSPTGHTRHRLGDLPHGSALAAPEIEDPGFALAEQPLRREHTRLCRSETWM